MNKTSSLILLALASSLSLLSFAADDYTVPRTEWGQPDLQGVWNFSSNVRMQREERFGERQFLTEEEIAEALEEGIDPHVLLLKKMQEEPTALEEVVEDFVEEVEEFKEDMEDIVEEMIEGTLSFWQKVRRFFRRLFGR